MPPTRLSLAISLLLCLCLHGCLAKEKKLKSTRTTTTATTSKYMPEVDPKLIQQWARIFSDEIVQKTADVATQVKFLEEQYSPSNGVTVEKYDPEEILASMSKRVYDYLVEKENAVKKLMDQAEATYIDYQYGLGGDDCKDQTARLDDILDKDCFFRYFAARCNKPSLYGVESKADQCPECPDPEGFCVDNRANIFGQMGVECKNNSLPEFSFEELECKLNGRFYGQRVNLTSSAVHVPTLIYERDPEMLDKIRWTQRPKDKFGDGFFDQVAKVNLANDITLGFQFFCSATGFLRYYPATNWNYEPLLDKYDKFDCRLTPWYNNAAMPPKLMIILVDLSGSMFGQRFELAKKLVDMILKTLSENDYFNIIMFNQGINWASDCLKEQMVQATPRYKRVMLKSMKNKGNLIGGMSNFPTAFQAAFDTLRHPQGNQSEGNSSESHTKSKPPHFDQNWPCNQAIMLITDGAPDTYTETLDRLNSDKRVRFFTYLIGLETHEAPNVRAIACDNRGHFVHIANDADIQANIHHYVNRMSRPLAMHLTHDPVWSSIYFDQLTDDIVTTVSVPVFDKNGDDVSNYTVLGVVGTAITTVQLERLAPKYLLGANAYTFMVNNNGFVLFHPRFRPQGVIKGQRETVIYKPNYNSIDILEVEVTEDRIVLNNASQLDRTLNYNANQMRNNLMNGIKGTQGPDKLMLVADDMRRLYRQERTIYYMGIDSKNNNSIPFSLGIGIPENSTHRIKLTQTLDQVIRNLRTEHFSTPNFLVHEDWEYCQWNDEESNKQEHFIDYLRVIVKEKEVPKDCKDKWLMQHVLFDLKVSHDLEKKWVSASRKLKPERGVFLTYISTRSGLTRYLDLNNSQIVYEAPGSSNLENDTEAVEEPKYVHFITTRNNSIDNPYYKRALFAPAGTWVFDVDRANRVWSTKEFESVYDRPENISSIVTARKAIYTVSGSDKAPAAVVGFEMTYDSFARMLITASGDMCKENNTDHYSCYLVDYHGYVLLTSRGFSYHPDDPNNMKDKQELRQYFGDIEPGVMNELVRNDIYQRQLYIDYQALCANETLDSAGMRILNPIFNILSAITYAWKQLVLFFMEYSVLSILSGWIWPVTGYSDFYNYENIGMSCDEFLPYYTLNKDVFANDGTKTYDFSYRCALGSMECIKSIGAVMIPATSMLLVVIKPSEDCLDSRCEPWSAPDDLNFTQTVSMKSSTAYGDKLYSQSLNWRVTVDEHTSAEVEVEVEKKVEKPPKRCEDIKPRNRRPNSRTCHWRHENATYDHRFQCSRAYRLTPISISLLTALLLLTVSR